MILFMILWKIYVEGIDLPNQTLTHLILLYNPAGWLQAFNNLSTDANLHVDVGRGIALLLLSYSRMDKYVDNL